MFGLPTYYSNTEWYNQETDELKNGAPVELLNEYRFYHASHYFSDKNDKRMVAQYYDKDGKAFVLNHKGEILYQGLVDQAKYPIEWDL